MLETEKLNLLKVMLGEENVESEEILSAYLTIAGNKILAKAYPYDDGVTEVPQKYHALQCEIAMFLLNKRGAEGQSQHSENGIVRIYETADVPPSMLRIVVPHVGVLK